MSSWKRPGMTLPALSARSRASLMLAALLTLLVPAMAAGMRPPEGLPQTGLAVVELRIGEHTITAEVADTGPARRDGLMYREDLPENRGMLFIWDEPDTYAMWMMNTPLPLSVAFIDRDGRITNIEDMAPFTMVIHKAVKPVIYALEMHQGWFERHGISVGDRVSGLPE